MITDAYVDGQRISLDPTTSIGKGGEADVYSIKTAALKVFKTSDHPDYKDEPFEQESARERIITHQRKIPALIQLAPRLPTHVVVPVKSATDRKGQVIVGYTMQLLRGAEVLLNYSDKDRHDKGLAKDLITKVFIDLHATVAGSHSIGVVFGDFNSLNVLVINGEAYVIDVDSAQFARFLCNMYTERYVDPLRCDPDDTSPTLVKPYNMDSDWYAYTVMLMQSFLCVGPYAGVYRPKDKAKRVPHSARPLRRITVFDPGVIYPKDTIAFHFEILPDDLIHRLHEVFRNDLRGEFPVDVLKGLRWTRCTVCGLEHARDKCPSCDQAAPAAIKQVTAIRGQVKATRIFQTQGTIVFADFQDNELRWLYHEGEEYKRENDSPVLRGALHHQLRFRIQGSKTLLGSPKGLVLVSSGVAGEVYKRVNVECFGNLPMFAANADHYYWVQDGRLMRDETFAPKYIGDVLSNQTLFWVGPAFGFGFYRAGNLSIAFIFDAKQTGINDSVKLPPLRGQLIDSTCFFTKDYCWFFVAMQEKGKTINRCIVIRANGSIKATAEAEEGDGSWLSRLRGKCALGKFLFVATDAGIIRVEPDGNSIVVTGEFPDTEPFVSSGSHLFAGDGIYVVDRNEIKLLQIG